MCNTEDLEKVVTYYVQIKEGGSLLAKWSSNIPSTVSGNVNGWRFKSGAADKLGELIMEWPPQKWVREYRVIKQTTWERVEAEVVNVRPTKYDRFHFSAGID
jgi:hypothetical protein